MNKKKRFRKFNEEISRIFQTERETKGYEINVEFKGDAKVTQQNGRRAPLQL